MEALDVEVEGKRKPGIEVATQSDKTQRSRERRNLGRSQSNVDATKRLVLEEQGTWGGEWVAGVGGRGGKGRS